MIHFKPKVRLVQLKWNAFTTLSLVQNC